MLNCKIFGHKWNKKLEGDIRTCVRCKFIQKYEGFTMTLNRTELSAIANNRVSKAMWKKYWWVILTGFAFLFSTVGVEGWASIPLFAIGLIILGSCVGSFIEKASKELDNLTK